LELLKRVVLSSSDKDDLVLDPFNGSGTTGLIANKYGRKYIGIDIEKDYLDLTLRRINKD
jgi:site-specific DNA-methyltransferase (adenine-specific)